MAARASPRGKQIRTTTCEAQQVNISFLKYILGAA